MRCDFVDRTRVIPCAHLRNVKGVLFADYVRMLRSHKGIDWRTRLPAQDLPFLQQHVTPDAWYPMDTFERFGNAILEHVARGSLDAVRVWGRFSVDQLRAVHPQLVAPRDPVETLTRFRILRSTFFDFEAIAIPLLHEDEARVTIDYGMGMPAEEAASFQTMGFFERILEVSGAAPGVTAKFLQRSWIGDPDTVLELSWRMGR